MRARRVRARLAQHTRGDEHVREGQRHVERLGEDVRRCPHQRRIERGDPGRDAAGARTGDARRRRARSARRRARRATDCAILIGGERVERSGGPRDRRQEQRIERRAPEPLRLGLARRGSADSAKPRPSAQVGGRATGTRVRRASAACRPSSRTRTPAAAPGRPAPRARSLVRRRAITAGSRTAAPRSVRRPGRPGRSPRPA